MPVTGEQKREAVTVLAKLLRERYAIAGTAEAAARDKGRFASLPLAKGWTQTRDMPAPQGATFQAQWKKQKGARR